MNWNDVLTIASLVVAILSLMFAITVHRTQQRQRSTAELRELIRDCQGAAVDARAFCRRLLGEPIYSVAADNLRNRAANLGVYLGRVADPEKLPPKSIREVEARAYLDEWRKSAVELSRNAIDLQINLHGFQEHPLYNSFTSTAELTKYLALDIDAFERGDTQLEQVCGRANDLEEVSSEFIAMAMPTLAELQ